jgi:hypothetical protein
MDVYIGPYDAVSDLSGQANLRAVLLSSVPASAITLSDLEPYIIPGFESFIQWAILPGIGNLADLGVLYGPATFDLSQLGEGTVIAGVGVLGGPDQSYVVGIIPVVPPPRNPGDSKVLELDLQCIVVNAPMED